MALLRINGAELEFYKDGGSVCFDPDSNAAYGLPRDSFFIEGEALTPELRQAFSGLHVELSGLLQKFMEDNRAAMGMVKTPDYA